MNRLKQGVESRARKLLEDNGLLRIPVPVEDVARSVGAVISYQPFDADDVSGLLYRETNQAPVIGVNSANSSVRQRFTIAHEIGHLCSSHDGQALILDRTVRVNWRDTTSSAATDQQEMEANAFAAALLMPEQEIRQRLSAAVRGRALGDDAVVDGLAKDFRVSRQAMEFRLANLGLLSPSG